jgi:hypothetical protein
MEQDADAAVPPQAAAAHAPYPHVILRDEMIEHVPEFKYLGSMVTRDHNITRDVSYRIARAAHAFHLMRRILCEYPLRVRTKARVYKAVVVNNLVYGAEAWCPRASDIHRLEVFQMRCLLMMLGVSRVQHYKNVWIRRLFGVDLIENHVIEKHRLRWVGHVGRMDATRIPLQLLSAKLEGPRPVGGGTPKPWQKLVAGNLSYLKWPLGKRWQDWREMSSNRSSWEKFVKENFR